jgi:hypothetical protein
MVDSLGFKGTGTRAVNQQNLGRDGVVPRALRLLGARHTTNNPTQ